MDSFLCKDLILKRKNKLIIASIIYVVILFLIGGNISIISKVNKDVADLTKESIINDCFSINYFKYVFLFIMYALTSLLFFDKKQKELEAVLEERYTAKQMLFSKVTELMIPITVGLTVNMLIKMILYFVKFNILNNEMNISFLLIITSFMFNIFVFLIYVFIIYIAHLAIKDLFVAAIFPIFMVEGIFAIFGAGTLLLSNKLGIIKKILYPISDIVMLAITKMFYKDIRFENQSVVLQFLTISFLVSMLVLFGVWAYESIKRIDNDKIKKMYRFKFFQVTFYILISYFVAFCCLGVLPYIIPASNEINLDTEILCFNLVSFILMPLIYYLLKRINKRKMTIKSIDKKIEKTSLLP